MLGKNSNFCKHRCSIERLGSLRILSRMKLQRLLSGFRGLYIARVMMLAKIRMNTTNSKSSCVEILTDHLLTQLQPQLLAWLHQEAAEGE